MKSTYGRGTTSDATSSESEPTRRETESERASERPRKPHEAERVLQELFRRDGPALRRHVDPEPPAPGQVGDEDGGDDHVADGARALREDVEEQDDAKDREDQDDQLDGAAVGLVPELARELLLGRQVDALADGALPLGARDRDLGLGLGLARRRGVDAVAVAAASEGGFDVLDARRAELLEPLVAAGVEERKGRRVGPERVDELLEGDVSQVVDVDHVEDVARRGA